MQRCARELFANLKNKDKGSSSSSSTSSNTISSSGNNEGRDATGKDAKLIVLMNVDDEVTSARTSELHLQQNETLTAESDEKEDI